MALCTPEDDPEPGSRSGRTAGPPPAAPDDPGDAVPAFSPRPHRGNAPFPHALYSAPRPPAQDRRNGVAAKTLQREGSAGFSALSSAASTLAANRGYWRGNFSVPFKLKRIRHTFCKSAMSGSVSKDVPRVSAPGRSQYPHCASRPVPGRHTRLPGRPAAPDLRLPCDSAGRSRGPRRRRPSRPS